MGLIKNMLYSQARLLRNMELSDQAIFPYYHTVSNDDLPHVKHIYPIKDEKQFIADLEYLARKYKILYPSVFMECLLNDKPLPERSFLLTFDDGMSEVYHVIYPILKSKGIPAVFFLNNSFIDNKNLFYRHQISLIVNHLLNEKTELSALQKAAELLKTAFDGTDKLISEIRKVEFPFHGVLEQVNELLGLSSEDFLETTRPYLSSAQVVEMKNEGFYFGGHTVNHFPLRKLSPEEQKKEIIDSVKWVKDHFDIPYSLFAFPFSDKGIRLSLFESLYEEFPGLVLMGNSGIRKDTAPRMVQRFSLEDPNYSAEDTIPVALAHAQVNKLIFRNKIRR